MANTNRHVDQVKGRNGLKGTVVSWEAQPQEPRVLVRLDNGQQILVPTEVLRRRTDGTFYLPYDRARLEQLSAQAASAPAPLAGAAGPRDATANDAAEATAGDHGVIPVIEERLVIEKRKRVTGRVRISKHVHERQESVDFPLLRDEVDVERVPVNRMVEGAVGLRYEGDTLIVPVLEEVLVIEKRVVLREELRITRRRTETHNPQTVTLRREEVSVERNPEPEGEAGDAAFPDRAGLGGRELPGTQNMQDETRAGDAF